MGAPEGNTNAQLGQDPQESFLHLRVARSDKARWVRAAQRRRMKLAEWVREALDRSAGTPRQ